MSTPRRMSLLALASVAALAIAPPAYGQGIGVGASIDVETIRPTGVVAGDGEYFVVYGADFYCGTLSPPLGAPLNPLVPGTYKNVIQVLNPNPNPVDLTLQVLLTDNGAGIPGTPPSVRGPEIAASLEAVDAFEIDCESIAAHTGLSPAVLGPFYRGFVLLRVRLDAETQVSKASYKLIVQDVQALKNIEPAPVFAP